MIRFAVLNVDSRLHIFNYIASALTMQRQRNRHGKNTVHLDNSELEVARKCWSTAAIVFGPLQDLDIPYIGYFLVELSSIDEIKFRLNSWTSEGILLKTLTMLSREEVEEIRKEGEKAIGRDSEKLFNSLGRRISSQIQDVVRHLR